MKWLILILLILLAGLQYRLWISEGSLADVVRLQEEIRVQELENTRLRERNRVLATEVKGLKSGMDAVEAMAREDLGMIKPGETFFMVVDPADSN